LAGKGADGCEGEVLICNLLRLAAAAHKQKSPAHAGLFLL
jgi:hypothetical protein